MPAFNLERKLVRLSKTKSGMASALVLLFIMLVICTVLSIEQAFPVNDAYDVQLMGGFFSAWNTNVCRNLLVQFLSPFLFNFKVHAFDQDLGLLGCPWRERNSILRLSFLTLILISCIWQFVIIITGNGQHFWRMLCWSQFFWFFMMSVMFVLDADGIYSGYNACINNFDVGGFGPIVLTLVGASFTTTLPPYFYSNPFFIPYQNEDSDTLIIEDFAITDGCHIAPFMYLILSDIACMALCYAVYRMSRLYDFGLTKGTDDEYDDDEECGCFDDKSRSQRPSLMQRMTSKTKTTTQQSQGGRHKDSMADFDANKRTHKTTPVFPNIYETEIHGVNASKARTDSLREPEHWKPRKATYEQNFS